MNQSWSRVKTDLSSVYRPEYLQQLEERAQAIVSRRDSGETFRSIAKDLSISPSRVAQIYNKQKRSSSK